MKHNCEQSLCITNYRGAEMLKATEESGFQAPTLIEKHPHSNLSHGGVRCQPQTPNKHSQERRVTQKSHVLEEYRGTPMTQSSELLKNKETFGTNIPENPRLFLLRFTNLRLRFF